jgi:hypothetical protein
MKALLLALSCLLTSVLFAQNTIPVSGSTGTTTWTSNNVYILTGYVFVESGQVLTIEPGTVVKGAPGSGVDASALIVTKGGQLIADGTAEFPIIFTFEGDPLDGSVAYDTRGQWGGIIILGQATTNFGGPAQIEGIPTDNNLAEYGGDNDADNSGILRYVSIRHGGTELGAANEINGLTLAGVGSGTTLDHIEIVSNLDDGIEFFGGAVSATHVLVAFCGDDSFDWDQGYHGADNAHWLAIQDQPGLSGDRGGELDGDDSDDGNVSADEMPLATPTVTGWTIVGVGDGQGLLFRNGSGGHVSNGLFANVAEGIEIEDKESPLDAFDHFLSGDLTLSNIKMFNCEDALDYDGTAVEDGDAQLDAYAVDNGIEVLNGLDIDDQFNFDVAGQQATDPINVDSEFGSGQDWALGWTFCDERSLFGSGVLQVATQEQSHDVLAFPNPFAHAVSLALPNHAGTDWIMINANGRLIHSGHTQQSVLQINTANLPSGVYFLRGTDGQYAWSTVVMKRD